MPTYSGIASIPERARQVFVPLPGDGFPDTNYSVTVNAMTYESSGCWANQFTPTGFYIGSYSAGSYHWIATNQNGSGGGGGTGSAQGPLGSIQLSDGDGGFLGSSGTTYDNSTNTFYSNGNFLSLQDNHGIMHLDVSANPTSQIYLNTDGTTGSIALFTSQLTISLPISSGAAGTTGQYLGSDGAGSVIWSTPPTSGGAQGPNGAIQLSDGDGGFTGSNALILQSATRNYKLIGGGGGTISFDKDNHTIDISSYGETFNSNITLESLGSLRLFSGTNLYVAASASYGTTGQYLGSDGAGSVVWSTPTGIQGATGVTGNGITLAVVNGSGNLIITYTSGLTANAGYVVGPSGPKGDNSIVPGPQGPQGPQGITGETGPAGPSGPKGDNSTIPGPTGSTGPKGDNSIVPGPQGPAGPQGTTGKDGITGNGITGALVNGDGNLIITYTSGLTANAGYVVGPQGATGTFVFSGTTGSLLYSSDGSAVSGSTYMTYDGTYALVADNGSYLQLNDGYGNIFLNSLGNGDVIIPYISGDTAKSNYIQIDDGSQHMTIYSTGALSILPGAFGGNEGDVLTSASGNVVWSTPTDASTWSTFPATQQVDLAGNYLEGVTFISDLGGLMSTLSAKDVDGIQYLTLNDKQIGGIGSTGSIQLSDGQGGFTGSTGFYFDNEFGFYTLYGGPNGNNIQFDRAGGILITPGSTGLISLQSNNDIIRLEANNSYLQVNTGQSIGVTGQVLTSDGSSNVVWDYPTQPSGFYDSGDIGITLSDNGGPGSSGGTLIGTTNIVTSTLGYILGTFVANFKNLSNAEELIDMYVTIDGTTGSVTRSSIIKDQGTHPGYVSITLTQRTNTKVVAGTYTANVYAYTESASVDVSCDHIDISLLGNLS